MALLSNPSPAIIFPLKPTKLSLSSLRNQTFVPIRLSHSSEAICFKQPKFSGKMNLRGSCGSSSMLWHDNIRKVITTHQVKSSLLKRLQDYIEKVKDGIYQVPKMLNDEDTITCLCNIVSDSVSVLASNKFKIVYSVLKNSVSLIYKKWKNRNLSTKSTQKPDDDAELKQTTSVNPQCEEGTAIEDGAQELVEMEEDFMEFGSQN